MLLPRILAFTLLITASSALALPPATSVSNEALTAGIRQAMAELDPAIGAPFDLDYLQDHPLTVRLSADDWARSAREPVALESSFGLLGGNLYIASYFRKSVYSSVGQEIIDDTPPAKIGARQPYYVIGDSGKLTYRPSGGGPAILEQLAAEGKTLRLYRGTTRFELAISTYLRDLLRAGPTTTRWGGADAKAFAAVLKKTESDPVNREQKEYFPRWRKFLKAQEKAQPTHGDFVMAALDQISGGHNATFTTPSLAGARHFAFKEFGGSKPLPYGAVLSYELDPRELSALASEVYAGVEVESSAYLEIGFAGPRARELLMRSLRDEAILK